MGGIDGLGVTPLLEKSVEPPEQRMHAPVPPIVLAGEQAAGIGEALGENLIVEQS